VCVCDMRVPKELSFLQARAKAKEDEDSLKSEYGICEDAILDENGVFKKQTSNKGTLSRFFFFICTCMFIIII
jgi:hypothetical protein